MGGWLDLEKVSYLMALLKSKPQYIPVDQSLALYLDPRLRDMGYTFDQEKTQAMPGSDFWYRRLE